MNGERARWDFLQMTTKYGQGENPPTLIWVEGDECTKEIGKGY